MKRILQFLSPKERFKTSSFFHDIQFFSGLFLFLCILTDILITKKLFYLCFYVPLFGTIAFLSAQLFDCLVKDINNGNFLFLKSEIHKFDVLVRFYKNAPKPIFLTKNIEEEKVITCWVQEIIKRYISVWYNTTPKKSFIVDVNKELTALCTGVLRNLQTRNWRGFALKLSNLILFHLKKRDGSRAHPSRKHPICTKIITEQDYLISASSALLNKFGNKIQHTSDGQGGTALHHLILSEIIANQLLKKIVDKVVTGSFNTNRPLKSVKSLSQIFDHNSSPKKIIKSQSFNNSLEESSKSISTAHYRDTKIFRRSTSNPECVFSSEATSDPILKTNSHNDSYVLPPSNEDEECLSYEDNEDLESTIGKLRQLLSEKQNSAEDNLVKVPTDGRIFFNLQIKEEGADAYLISYDAVIINKSASTVPYSNQFEYSTKSLHTTRCYDDFVLLEKDLSKEYNLELSEGLEAGDKKVSHLLAWLNNVIHHYEASSSNELKRFLRYQAEDLIDLQLQKNEKSPRIDKFLAKTVSGVFNSIKDVLPNFDEDNTHGGSFGDAENASEEIEPGYESCQAIREKMVEYNKSDRQDFENLMNIPSQLKFTPFGNDISEFETSLIYAIEEETQTVPKRSNKFKIEEHISLGKAMIYKNRINQEILKEEMDGKLSDKVIEILILIFVEDLKYSWLKSSFIVDLLKRFFSDSANEHLFDILYFWTSPNAWKAIFMELRQILWYSSNCDPEAAKSNEVKTFICMLLKKSFLSEEDKKEFIYDLLDLILATFLEEEIS